MKITFVDLWKGIFYLVSSLSVVVVLLMFVFVWQPIWTAGFKDFHTISEAISKLDKTAKPASEAIPLLLVELTEMNKSVSDMGATIVKMQSSIETIEEINPNIVKMNNSMENMIFIMYQEMGKVNYEMDRMGDKFSPIGMMTPFNW